jgi:hypothetical protein
MTLLSKQVIEKFGPDSIRIEFKRLNKLFHTYSDVKNTSTVGQSFGGVGTFGHDSEGNYELSSLYQFYDDDKVVYHFTLYYNESNPVDVIKYYDSWEFSEFKNLRLTKPIK